MKQKLVQILLYFFAASFAALGFVLSVTSNDLGLQCFAVLFYCMAAVYLIMGWFWLK